MEKTEVGKEYKGPIWHHYFSSSVGKKDPTLSDILDDKIRYYKLYYPFLQISQIMGKVYEELEIPHSFGTVDRWKLHKLYQNAIKLENSNIEKPKGKKRLFHKLNVEIKKKSTHQSITKTIVKPSEFKSPFENERITQSFKRQKTVRFEEGIEIHDISPNLAKSNSPYLANKPEIKKKRLYKPKTNLIEIEPPCNEKIVPLPKRTSQDAQLEFLQQFSLSKADSVYEYKTNNFENNSSKSLNSECHIEEPGSNDRTVPDPVLNKPSDVSSTNLSPKKMVPGEPEDKMKEIMQCPVSNSEFLTEEMEVVTPDLTNSEQDIIEDTLEETNIDVHASEITPKSHLRSRKLIKKKLLPRSKPKKVNKLRGKKIHQAVRDKEYKSESDGDKDEEVITKDDSMLVENVQSDDEFHENFQENADVQSNSSLSDIILPSQTTEILTLGSLGINPLSYSNLAECSKQNREENFIESDRDQIGSRNLVNELLEDFFSSHSEEELETMATTLIKNITMQEDMPNFDEDNSLTKENISPKHPFKASKIAQCRHSDSSSAHSSLESLHNISDDENDRKLNDAKNDKALDLSSQISRTSDEVTSQLAIQEQNKSAHVISKRIIHFEQKPQQKSSTISLQISNYGPFINSPLLEPLTKNNTAEQNITSNNKNSPEADEEEDLIKETNTSNNEDSSGTSEEQDLIIEKNASSNEGSSVIDEEEDLIQETPIKHDTQVGDLIGVVNIKTEREENVGSDGRESDSSGLDMVEDDSFVEVSTSYETDPETGQMITVRFIPKIKTEIKSEEDENVSNPDALPGKSDSEYNSDYEQYNESHKIGLCDESIFATMNIQTRNNTSSPFTKESYIKPGGHSETEDESDSPIETNLSRTDFANKSNIVQSNNKIEDEIIVQDYENNSKFIGGSLDSEVKLNNLNHDPEYMTERSVVSIQEESNLRIHDGKEALFAGEEDENSMMSSSSDEKITFNGTSLIQMSVGEENKVESDNENIIISPNMQPDNNYFKQWLKLNNERSSGKKTDECSNITVISDEHKITNIVQNPRDKTIKNALSEQQVSKMLSSSCPVYPQNQDNQKQKSNDRLSLSEGMIDYKCAVKDIRSLRVSKLGVVNVSKTKPLQFLNKYKKRLNQSEVSMDGSKNIISATDSSQSERHGADTIKLKLHTQKTDIQEDQNWNDILKNSDSSVNEISLHDENLNTGQTINSVNTEDLMLNYSVVATSGSSNSKDNAVMPDVFMSKNVHYEHNSSADEATSPSMIKSSDSLIYESGSVKSKKIHLLQTSEFPIGKKYKNEDEIINQRLEDDNISSFKIEDFNLRKFKELENINAEILDTSLKQMKLTDVHEDNVEIEPVDPIKMEDEVEEDFEKSTVEPLRQASQLSRKSIAEGNVSSSLTSPRSFSNEDKTLIEISDESLDSSQNSQIDSSARKKKIRTDLRKKRAKMIKNQRKSPYNFSSSSPEDSSIYQRKLPRKTYKEHYHKETILQESNLLHKNIHKYVESSSETHSGLNTSKNLRHYRGAEYTESKIKFDGACNFNTSTEQDKSDSTKKQLCNIAIDYENQYRSSLASIRNKGALLVNKVFPSQEKSNDLNEIIEIPEESNGSGNEKVESAVEKSPKISWNKTISMREALNQDMNLLNLIGYSSRTHRNETQPCLREVENDNIKAMAESENECSQKYTNNEIQDIEESIPQNINDINQVTSKNNKENMYTSNFNDKLDENIQKNTRKISDNKTTVIKIRQPLVDKNIVDKTSTATKISGPGDKYSHTVKFKQPLSMNTTEAMKRKHKTLSSSVSKDASDHSSSQASLDDTMENSAGKIPNKKLNQSPLNLSNSSPTVGQGKTKYRNSSTSDSIKFPQDDQMNISNVHQSPDSCLSNVDSPYKTNDEILPSRKTLFDKLSSKNNDQIESGKKKKSSVVRYTDKVYGSETTSPEVEILMRRTYFMNDKKY